MMVELVLLTAVTMEKILQEILVVVEEDLLMPVAGHIVVLVVLVITPEVQRIVLLRILELWDLAAAAAVGLMEMAEMVEGLLF